MDLPLTLTLTAVLLGLNAFFAMAEFAIVRVRATRVAELAQAGNRRALALREIHANIDEYLSVVQVGITCAGIGLGLVLDEGLSRLMSGAFAEPGLAQRLGALVIAFLAATYLSIVLGELVPKALAIRDPERLALRSALPMRFFHRLFWLPLKVLSGSARVVLAILGFGRKHAEAPHTEGEIRSILGTSQQQGTLSFRQLLMLENVLDLSVLRVRDATRPRSQARTLDVGMGMDAIVEAVRTHRFSRYLLVDPKAPPSKLPIGVIHVKDLFTRDPALPLDLRATARPYLTFGEDTPLDQALREFQRAHNHLAVVMGTDGNWTGIMALEDVLEDVIGQIHDEFERDPIELEDAVRGSRVLLDVEAGSVTALVRQMVESIPASGLPSGVDHEVLVRALAARERTFSTYAGRAVALPNARVPGLHRPIVVFARLREDLPVQGRLEAIRIVFLLVTPASDPHVHVRLLERIVNVVDSEYILSRLLAAPTVEQISEALAEGSRVASS